MALELESFEQRFGANSFRHRAALINLERYICGFHFIAVHGKSESKLVHSFTFRGSIKVDAAFALNVSRHYTNFLYIFPLWHKDHERAELMPNGAVRFHIPRNSTRQRQVIAYHNCIAPLRK